MSRQDNAKALLQRSGATWSVLYPSYATPLSEKVVVTLSGGRRQRDVKKYVRYIQAAYDTMLAPGYVVDNALSSEPLLIVNKEQQYFGEAIPFIRFQAMTTNLSASFYQQQKTVGVAGGIKATFDLYESAVPCGYYPISDLIRAEQSGPREDLIKQIFVPGSVGCQQFDRISFGGQDYVASVVDNSLFAGISVVTINKDER
jgi:hypothetical protein